MVAGDIEGAIEQIRDLRAKIIENQVFKGYSGVARLMSGCVALVAAVVMSRPSYPVNVSYHMAGWALVYTIAVFLNGGALFGRFLRQSTGLHDWYKLKPVWDVVPPLVAAGTLTLHLFLVDREDSLFGLWMLMYGLIHLSTKHTQPRFIEHVGWYYLLCGVFFLIAKHSFLNPWPMGIVFFVGELAGGLVFLSARRKGI